MALTKVNLGFNSTTKKCSIFITTFLLAMQIYYHNLEREDSAWKRSKKDSILVLEDVLYFNRIPKTGSENFAFLLRTLSKMNNFTAYRYSHPEPRHLSEKEQKDHVTHVLAKPQRPLAYDRHVHFIDFAKLTTDQVQPIWFSIIRDPIDKFVSRYFYNRGGKGILYDKMAQRNESIVQGISKDEWRNKDIVECILDENDDECNFKPGIKSDLAMPYFCGQNDECSVIQSDWALKQAKENINQWYPVVGVLEDLQMTLFVLEQKLPLFFKGVSQTYYETLKEPHKNHGKPHRNLPTNAYKILRKKLHHEYELYTFARQRLKRQSRELKLWRIQKTKNTR